MTVNWLIHIDCEICNILVNQTDTYVLLINGLTLSTDLKGFKFNSFPYGKTGIILRTIMGMFSSFQLRIDKGDGRVFRCSRIF